MLEKAVYYVVALLVTFATFFDGQFAPSALAQTVPVTPPARVATSHRLLPLPVDGTEDLLQQFRMLQHLQDLVAQRENDQATPQLPTPQGIVPELLDRLRSTIPADQQQRLLDLAQEHLGNIEGMDANAKSKLKSAVEKLTSDPASAQATAEELLRQFHQTRQLPFMPKSSTSNSTPSLAIPDRSSKADTGLPLEPPRMPSTPPSMPEPTTSLSGSARGLRPINPTMTRQPESDRQYSSPHDSTQNSLPNKTQMQSQPANNLGSSGRTATGLDVGTRMLDDVIRQTLGENAIPAPTDQPQIPTVAELLKQSKEDPSSLPSLKIPENSLNMDEIKKFLAERFSNLKKDEDPWLDSLKKRLPTSFKAELHKAGIHQSLSKVMDDMKKGNQKRSDDSQTVNRQLELDALQQESMGATLSSIKKDLDEFSKEMNSSSQSTARSNQPSASRTNPTGSTSAKSEKAKEGFFKQASGMFNKWLPNSKKQDSPSSTDAAPQNSSATSNVLQVLLAMGLCVGLLVAAVWYLGRWQHKQSVAQLDGAASLAISTRADIVQAFHLLVNASGMSIEEWWTHRRAAAEISKHKPGTAHNLELLSRLYEIARYSPAEYRLSPEQIQQARRALEQIATC